MTMIAGSYSNLSSRPDVSLVDCVAFRLQPQRHDWLLTRKTTLDEEVAERQHPELPLLHDAKKLFPCPRVVAKRLLPFGDQTLTLSLGFFLRDVESSGRLWKIWNKCEANKGYGQ
jgi:hypothetical protein